MKAIVQDKYGPPDGALELRDIDPPVVTDDEVLVRVRAASANTYNLDLPTSLQHIAHMAAGARGPTEEVPGLDLAGQVEATGKRVNQFQPGDEVFGWCKGSLAEFVSASTESLVMKPANLTFEQAAVVPISGMTALQGLRDKGGIQPGQDVLINGASGGVGTFAVQIAKAFGANVTGVCSAKNIEMVRSIGADHTVDYTQEDFTEGEVRYDLILDVAGNASVPEMRRALSPTGTLVMVGSSSVPQSGHIWTRGFGRLFQAMVLSAVTSQRLRSFLLTRKKEDLVALKGIIEAGHITPVISAHYPLSGVPEAIRHFEEGHARGKVVISMPGAK